MRSIRAPFLPICAPTASASRRGRRERTLLYLIEPVCNDLVIHRASISTREVMRYFTDWCFVVPGLPHLLFLLKHHDKSPYCPTGNRAPLSPYCPTGNRAPKNIPTRGAGFVLEHGRASTGELCLRIEFSEFLQNSEEICEWQ